MKKRYTILLSIFISEYFIVSILNTKNIKFESWIGNVIGACIFLLPIEILLYLLGKDESIDSKKRTFCKIALWFIFICSLAGAIVTLLEGKHLSVF